MVQYPLHHIKFFGMAHPGQNMCASLSTEGCDLTVIEYGYEPLYLGKKQLIRYTNELIGDKSSIQKYVSDLKSGRIRNVDPNGVSFVAPFKSPMQIGNYDEYWARIKVVFAYENNKDGALPWTLDQHLQHYTSLVIYDGKEYNFLKSDQNLRSGLAWSNVKEGLRNPDVVAEVDELTSFGAKDPSFKESEIFQLLGGAFSVHPWIIGSQECLRPQYLIDLLSTIRSIISKRNRLRTGYSVLDYLEKWSPLQKELFKKFYFDGIFRAKVVNLQDRSLLQFKEKLGKKIKNPILENMEYSTLTYHAGIIQNTLEMIHDHFIVGETGLEAELVYRILKGETTPTSLPSHIDNNKLDEGGEKP